MLLKYNPKDELHRGEYKNSNSVQAFDADGNSLGIWQEANPKRSPSFLTAFDPRLDR